MSCPAADVLSSSCLVTSAGFSKEGRGGKKKKKEEGTLNTNRDHYMVGGFAIQISSKFSHSLRNDSHGVRGGRGEAALLCSRY